MAGSSRLYVRIHGVLCLEKSDIGVELLGMPYNMDPCRPQLNLGANVPSALDMHVARTVVRSIPKYLKLGE